MKVSFVDMYPGFENDLATSPIFSYFQQWTRVRPEDDPDLLVTSVFGRHHLNFPESKKLLWSGENLALGHTWRKHCSFDDVDWALLTNYPEELDLPSQVNAHYLPYAAVHYDLDSLKTFRRSYLHKPKTKFCCFVTSRTGQSTGYVKRDKLFDQVSRNYRKVDSGGNHYNNLGFLVPRDTKKYFDWVSQYKFMICFENSAGPGYLTEKILTPYTTATIPIYWSDLSNLSFLEKEAMVFYSSSHETFNQIKMLDQNKDLYEKVQRRELLKPDREFLLTRQHLQNLLDDIVNELKS